MSGFSITMLIITLLGIYGSKTMRKMTSSIDVDDDADTQAVPEEDQAEDYFTYESMEDVQEEKTVEPQVARRAAPIAAPAEVAEATLETETPEFDLRQAVIYQTILHNDYADIR